MEQVKTESLAGGNDTNDAQVNASDCDHDFDPQKDEVSRMSFVELQEYLEANAKLISKNRRKKLIKRLEWLRHRPERRALQKEKQKRKRAEAKESPSEQPECKKQKITKMEDSSCKIKIAIDLSLDHHMTDRERMKCLKQLQRCYSLNRRAPDPVQLFLTGMGGSFKSHKVAINGFDNWDVHFSDADHAACFGKENVVYLSSESPNELSDLEEGKAYVIGGLVDHNRCRGLCHKLAEEQGIQHARLPIDSNLVLKTRKVLTIDQVFLILLKVTQGLDWKDAFLETIPQRKGAIAIENFVDSCDSVSADTDSSCDKQSA
ncbi:tRNA methyltransferase 10 homolog A-like [Ornithodoros turicata]|uniref:tRNA methyltransferase 10 homolog A-like n=1 Tax=Ornithodoros turicata TaxID=34597 RepID=UPI0031393202